MKKNYNRSHAMRFIILLMILATQKITAEAQTPFLKIYGGQKNEWLHKMIRSHDGGFIMAGSTESYGQGNSGNTDDYVVKIDSEGTIIWSRTLGLQSYDDIYWMEPTNDSSYIICGVASDNDTYIGLLLAKINESGNILWEKVLEEDNAGMGYCVRQTTDGGFIVAGEVVVDYNLDFLLIKTDGDGNILWSKQIGSSNPDVPAYVMQTSDGGFFICGNTRQNSATIPVYAVKTDSAGNVQWQKTYNTSLLFSRFNVSNVIATKDAGYLIAGSTTHDQLYGDVMLLKIDSGGSVEWTKAYGGDKDDGCEGILQNGHGNYVLCGASASSESSGNLDALVMLIDSSGNVLKSSLFGKTFADEDFSSIIELSDGGYMLGGTTASYNQFLNSDFMMMRIDNNLKGPSCDTLIPVIAVTNVFLIGQSDVTETDITLSGNDVSAAIDSGATDSLICDVATGIHFPPSQNSVLSIFPNPTRGAFKISFKEQTELNGSVNIQLINAEGQILNSSTEKISQGEFEKEFSLPKSLPSGIYMVQIISNETVYSERLIFLPED